MDSAEHWLLNTLFAPIWIPVMGITLVLAWYALHRLGEAVGKFLVGNYLAAKGARVILFYSAPTGPGWLGGRSPIYRVVYEDANANVHEAYCTTGLLAGVYFNDDKIIEQVKVTEDDHTG